MTFNKISPTVLLVDEFDNNCCLTRRWLETSGYRVRRAANISDAIDEATDFTQNQRPSLILLNMTLEAEDCEFVRDSLNEFEELKKIPIVAFAGHETDAGQNEYFVQVENLEKLKPLMKSLLPFYAETNTVAAAA